MKICFVATVPYVVNAFLRDHLIALSKRFSVTVVTGNDNSLAPLDLPPEIGIVRMNLCRQPSVTQDFLALLFLWRLFRRERFISVHTITPKAGLLGMAAAFSARIPCRLHHFTGQVWATRSGLSRWVYKLLDSITARLATQVFTDGYAQAEFLSQEGVISAEDVIVLGPGPICGVDTQRFYPDIQQKAEVRKKLSISSSSVVILFVGRLHREKGLLDLIQAMEILLSETPKKDLILLLVGPPDDVIVGQRLEDLPKTLQSIIRRTGGVPDPERYMRAADIFVLPSHREGFGMVVLEAAASGLPAVVSDIYGLRDAVVENVTALKAPANSPSELACTMRRLINDSELRVSLSQAAVHRVATTFSRESITATWLSLYDEVADGSRNRQLR